MGNKQISKKELLLTPIWSAKDIANYFGKGKSFGQSTKNRVADKYGTSIYGTQYVMRDDVLDMFGTTPENELKIIARGLENGFEEKL